VEVEEPVEGPEVLTEDLEEPAKLVVREDLMITNVVMQDARRTVKAQEVLVALLHQLMEIPQVKLLNMAQVVLAQAAVAGAHFAIAMLHLILAILPEEPVALAEVP